MDTKAAFEKWVKTVMHDTDDLHEEWSMYANLNVRIRWEAWQASRAAIEIEIESLSQQYFASDIKNSFEHGRATERRKTIDVLTSHGIRIKGKKE